ncbi:MAG: alpha/beta hydrolase family protein [Gammaproteobacteria bacterium]|jgi:predicted esterase|nr:alpha/beta hydrolase family protein [Gammaproteobacteria bacterium]
MNRFLKLVGLIAVCLFAGASYASDAAKEKRWSDQIVDALMDGEAEYLKAGDQEFLAIYTEAADSPPKGGVILMHGIGVHPDWPQIVGPLRTGLPQRGWATLSLQMPILPNEADVSDYLPLMDEVAPRIDAGVAFLKAQGIDDIVLVGHSLGASMALRYLEQPRDAIQGLVVIGLAKDGELNPAVTLEVVSTPVLDLYGSEDQKDTLETAPERKAAAKSDTYTQKEVKGANHFFDGKEVELVEAVDVWGSAL